MELLSRLSLMLAAARFTDQEVMALAKQVKTIEDAELVRLVRSIRIDAEMSNALSGSAVGDASQRTSKHNRPVGEDVVANIQRLLVDEAGLTKIAAAQALVNKLRRRNPTGAVVPYNSKDGFARWLNQIAQEYSLSEILHAAASIRSSRVHSRGDDWLDEL